MSSQMQAQDTKFCSKCAAVRKIESFRTESGVFRATCSRHWKGKSSKKRALVDTMDDWSDYLEMIKNWNHVSRCRCFFVISFLPC